MAGLMHEMEAIVLHHFDQAPKFLQHNPHIHTGYRAFLTTRGCFKR
jgi:hypothetical protein